MQNARPIYKTQCNNKTRWYKMLVQSTTHTPRCNNKFSGIVPYCSAGLSYCLGENVFLHLSENTEHNKAWVSEDVRQSLRLRMFKGCFTLWIVPFSTCSNCDKSYKYSFIKCVFVCVFMHMLQSLLTITASVDLHMKYKHKLLVGGTWTSTWVTCVGDKAASHMYQQWCCSLNFY